MPDLSERAKDARKAADSAAFDGVEPINGVEEGFYELTHQLRALRLSNEAIHAETMEQRERHHAEQMVLLGALSAQKGQAGLNMSERQVYNRAIDYLEARADG